MKRRQADRGIETVDRLHQIKGNTQNIFRFTGRDQAGVGNITSGKRLQHARLTPHGVIAVLA